MDIFRMFFLKLNNSQWIRAIKIGFLKIQNIIIIGTIAIAVENISSKFEYNIFTEILGRNKWNLLEMITESTIGIMTLLLIISVSYSLVSIKINEEGLLINPIIPSLTSVVVSIALSIEKVTIIGTTANTHGIFIAIITSIIATEIYLHIYRRLEKKRLEGSFDYGDDYELNDFIDSFLPTLFTVGIAIILKIIILKVDINLFYLISYRVKHLFESVHSILPKQIIYLLGIQMFWFLGIHGGNIFTTVFHYPYEGISQNVVTNSNNIIISEIFSKSFFDVFVNIGGCGATICIIIAMYILKTSRSKSKLLKLASFTGIFNVNEIIIYGLPIVLNPIYIIPFIITPFILAIISYLAIYFGLVPMVNEVSWITPIFINSYISTGSASGVVLQVLNIMVGTLIYIPFVKLSIQFQIGESKRNFEDLKNEVFNYDFSSKYLTIKNNHIGAMARKLGNDLRHDIKNNKNLYLQYQPQVDRNYNVVGVEGLLRWNHPTLNNIPPNIMVTIAEELDIMNDLGLWVIETACKELTVWEENNIFDVDMSVNISTIQLKDYNFSEKVKRILEVNNTNPKRLKFEITENIEIAKDGISDNQLKKLEELGIRLAIDDFGKGYNPILYLKQYNIDTLKIDGSLIRDIEVDEISQNIIKAMDNLCKTSNLKLIVECVETITQKEVLDGICNCIYQGYLYSKPLDSNECIEYIKRKIYN